MIDTFAGKTKELIIMESDPNIMSWLQDWKRQTLDMEVENKFKLWKDENEVDEDLQADERPSESLLQLPNNEAFGQG
jgi:hypothetical protein